MDKTSISYVDVCKNMKVKHLVDLWRYHCFLAAGRNQASGKASFFLFFEKKEKIFYRPGKDRAWKEIHDQRAYRWIRNLIRHALICRQMGSLRQDMEQVF